MCFSLKTYLSVTWFLFVFIGLAHLIRAFMGSPAIIAGFAVPFWASWVVVVCMVLLAYNSQVLQASECTKKK
ncbi:hypothetical protein EXS73_02910 [Candidatus Pacearchaeota archaeon]|nr:hypothetical protein [Candidatus Pacearchaeota archaeon]